MSNHTIMLLFPMIVLLSLGGVFGRISLNGGVLHLDGSIREDPHHGQSKEMMSLWLSGVAYARTMGS
jgi:hypothetical protein